MLGILAAIVLKRASLSCSANCVLSNCLRVRVSSKLLWTAGTRRAIFSLVTKSCTPAFINATAASSPIWFETMMRGIPWPLSCHTFRASCVGKLGRLWSDRMTSHSLWSRARRIADAVSTLRHSASEPLPLMRVSMIRSESSAESSTIRTRRTSRSRSLGMSIDGTVDGSNLSNSSLSGRDDHSHRGYSETMDGSLYFKDACHEYWSELYLRMAGHLSGF